MASNRLRGDIEIELDKVRKLRLNFKVLAAIEAEGVAITKGFEPTISNILTVLWHGLKADDKDLTKDKLGEMIDMGNLQYVSEKLQEALDSGIGKKA